MPKKATATKGKATAKPTKAIKKAEKKSTNAQKGPAKALSKPKKAAQADSEKKVLELGLIIDTTGSMMPWITRAKKTLNEIISNVVKACSGNLTVRVCFIGYNDFGMTPRYMIHPFTEDTEKLKTWITNNVKTVSGIPSGNDWPEDLAGGLSECLK